ncbi:MAG: hypothetical protein LBK77_08350 [Spirochaetaceae bacterium]|jgi:hypothetical protein|nr:hypothetical protein [Spirochaetaceae bacterium]
MRISGIIYYSQVLFLLCVMVFASCGGKPVFTGNAESPGNTILPPPTPPLSRPVIGYGVISVSYTHVVSEPSALGFSLGYLRKSALVEVLERRLVSSGDLTESWVFVGGGSQGWLREDVIQVYDSEAKARTAVGSLLP